MKMYCSFFVVLIAGILSAHIIPPAETNEWIRINQLGYTPAGMKAAVWGSKDEAAILTFALIDSATGKTVYQHKAGKNYGSYGPFKATYRLNFSEYKKEGVYYLKAGNVMSPFFKINKNVYDGAADFCLQYMRQQRSGFNPFLKDSCHTFDGYTLYGPMPDSTHINVSGGWHDASDYLQYSTTSANATYHLLAAWRDFPHVFADKKQANGLDGKNGTSDVLDEARWGLEWLVKMHPRTEWMFNQLGDDRDHISMRIPKQDSQYGNGFERPVYFIDGKPQQRGRFLNNTTGTSSTAAKFASAFALGSQMHWSDQSFADTLRHKAATALDYSVKKRGVTQTVSVRSPYIYAEDNWTDDMELAFTAVSQTFPSKAARSSYYDSAFTYAQQESVTPWLGYDTANHYQWYPFINLGHYELAKQLSGSKKDTLIQYYKNGIEAVWKKAGQNAFYRGVPFIWCSNNLTASFAIQCYWYKQLTGDQSFAELEQANLDWLFGCNPWGTSMVYGLPSWGDTPVDPHSAFTHLKNYPINGGLVDGPVYTSIYKNLIGIKLMEPDEYAPFQSDLVVYHDDYGDYSTNEPTMDGTASLIYLLAAKEAEAKTLVPVYSHGALLRGNAHKKIALIFTGDEYAEGGQIILKTLKKYNAKASFFFTGRFYRNQAFTSLIKNIKQQGHYLGPHSNEHLLYCDWTKRDSLLVTRQQFTTDLQANLKTMKSLGINSKGVNWFVPPYEWYNDSIAKWTRQMGLQLVSFSPGTKSTADYTLPGESNYRSSDEIFMSIITKEKEEPNGLDGFILLMHVGAAPQRTDKFYNQLNKLMVKLQAKGYSFVALNEIGSK